MPKLKKIIEECKLKTINTQKKAKLYRIFNLITNLFIIVGSLFIGFIESQRENKLYSYIILSFLISIIKGLHMILRLGQRGTYFKYASIKYQKLITIANDKLFYLTNNSELKRLDHQLRIEMDELNLSLYKVSYDPDSLKSDQDNNSV